VCTVGGAHVTAHRHSRIYGAVGIGADAPRAPTRPGCPTTWEARTHARTSRLSAKADTPSACRGPMGRKPADGCASAGFDFPLPNHPAFASAQHQQHNARSRSLPWQAMKSFCPTNPATPRHCWGAPAPGGQGIPGCSSVPCAGR
jgi:hypothetical protein